MLSVNIKLYSFNELTEKAKNKAISDHRNFLLEALAPDYIDGLIDWNNPEKMSMYRDEYDYILFNDEPVIESIEINEYYFFFDGTIAPVLHCTAGPAAGITVANIHGENIRL